VFCLGHYAADEIKENIDDLDQKWLEFKVGGYIGDLTTDFTKAPFIKSTTVGHALGLKESE